MKLLIPLLLLLLSTLVRVLAVQHPGLGYDEAQTAAIAGMASFRQMFASIQVEGQCPLYYLVLRAWMAIFGNGDWALRMPSLLISIAVPVVVYRITARRAGEQVGLSAAALCAFCPPLVGASLEVRPYGLAALLSVLWFDQLCTLCQKPTASRERLKYSLLTAAFLYTHVLCNYVFLAHAAMMCWGRLRGWFQQGEFKSWLIAAVAGFALFAPWIFGLHTSAADSAHLWQHPIPAVVLLFSICLNLFWGGFRDIPDALKLGTALIALFGLLAAILYPLKSQSRPDASSTAWARNLHITVLPALLAAIPMYLVVQRYSSHYLAPVMPLLLILIACSLSRLATLGSGWKYAPALATALFLAVWTPTLLDFMQVPLAVEPLCAAAIQQKVNPQQDIVLCTCEPFCVALSRALPESVKLLSYPDIERVRLINWHGLYERALQGGNSDRLQSELHRVLSRGGKVWLVTTNAQATANLPQPNPKLPYEVLELINTAKIEQWLAANAKCENPPLLLNARLAAAEIRSFSSAAAK